MRKYSIKRPKEIFWVFMIFVLFILGAYFWYFQAQPLTITQEPIVDNRSFDEIVRDANAAYRKAYVDEGEEAAIKTVPDSISQWEKLIEKYRNDQPEEYARTSDWESKMDTMLVLVKEAEVYARSEEPVLAQAKLDELDAILKNIKEENDKIYLNDDFKDFFQILKLVSEAETKREALDHLNDLKFKFTQLKEYAVDEKYQTLIADLEKNIAKIDQLLMGPDFKEAQAQLKPIFAEIFVNYN